MTTDDRPVARERKPVGQDGADVWSYSEPERSTGWRAWLPPLIIGVVLLAGAVAIGASGAGRPPALTGYTHGSSIEFIHTEASSSQTAALLTGMAGSPVFTVPGLAQIPDSALGDVYVFTNGVQPAGPRGPLGFQPDVFDSVPGDPSYSPLRRLNLVTWKDGAIASVLKSTEDVLAAQGRGEVSIDRPGIVINMPMTRWPGGQR